MSARAKFRAFVLGVFAAIYLGARFLLDGTEDGVFTPSGNVDTYILALAGFVLVARLVTLFVIVPWAAYAAVLALWRRAEK